MNEELPCLIHKLQEPKLTIYLNASGKVTFMLGQKEIEAGNLTEAEKERVLDQLETLFYPEVRETGKIGLNMICE